MNFGMLKTLLYGNQNTYAPECDIFNRLSFTNKYTKPQIFSPRIIAYFYE